MSNNYVKRCSRSAEGNSRASHRDSLRVALNCSNQFDKTGRDAQKDACQIEPSSVQPAIRVQYRSTIPRRGQREK